MVKTDQIKALLTAQVAVLASLARESLEAACPNLRILRLQLHLQPRRFSKRLSHLGSGGQRVVVVFIFLHRGCAFCCGCVQGHGQRPPSEEGHSPKVSLVGAFPLLGKPLMLLLCKITQEPFHLPQHQS